MNHGHIKLPLTPPLPDSCIERRKLSDGVWKNYILFGLLKYFKEIDRVRVKRIVDNLGIKTENAISNNIYHWLISNRKFNSFEFVINREPRTDGDQEGYIDLKFQHSQWGNGNKHFSFEAKNLDGSSKLLNEYVYTKKKKKDKYIEDGGVFRFMTGKYAHNMMFGGMLGYVIKKCEGHIIDEVIGKIEEVYENNETGELSERIERNSIKENRNTFSTFHNRGHIPHESRFTLYHIIMDFIN